MKQTVSFLTLALLLSGLAACSSENNNVAATDAGGDEAAMDSSPTDTGAKVDSGTDTAVASGCATDLPSGYACPAFPVPAASTACTEAMLQEYAVKCVQADIKPGAECAAWKAANAACKTCVEAWSWDDAKTYPDDYKCYEKLVPGCGKSINCTFACADEVCTDCEDQASYDECTEDANRTGGRCFELAAKNASSCVDEPAGAPCEVSQYYTMSPDVTKLRAEAVRVLRGACRDNGDWSKSEMGGDDAGPSDTGTETGSDTGVSDTGASDTGTATDADSGD